MIQEFRLPDLGEGLAEAEIVTWLVAEGDPVTLNQTLAEVETAKAVVELPSPYAGTIRSLHAAAGDVVPVGAPLVGFEIEGEEPSVPVAAPTAESAPADAAASGPNLVGYGAGPAASGRPMRRARRTSAAPAAAAPAGAVMTDGDVRAAAPHDAIDDRPAPVRDERPRSTPPVRAYAKSKGVDLALVVAELGERVVSRADVDLYLERIDGRGADESVAAVAAPRAVPGERATTRIPVRGVRRATAEAMVRSAFTAPHVTTFHTVDVTATTELVAGLRASAAADAPRIGLLAIIAKAVCLALPRFPGLNSRWDEEAGEIVQQHFVDLGIAAATDRGLIVPIVRDADRLGLDGIATALGELTRTARAGRTAPADLVGGTFSLTNVGVFGIDAGTPILPPGQSGILAIGAVRRQPWEHQGGIALRDVLTLSLSFDHRIVDGAEGAQFLKTVADVLEQPGRAMLLA